MVKGQEWSKAWNGQRPGMVKGPEWSKFVPSNSQLMVHSHFCSLAFIFYNSLLFNCYTGPDLFD